MKLTLRSRANRYTYTGNTHWFVLSPALFAAPIRVGERTNV